ncbi:3'-5' exonuclease [Paraburkholderia tropica]|uniref:3'-5' exonuclease n=1 Tax=Paraburkholderia tropica TaxID=92647 RepID=UPI002AAFFB6B|nr:3'-5' exonuclease [Paraburkholderia tropica]
MISTVHRAKGMEWKRLRVANDFRFRVADASPASNDAEIQLHYVAITRAKHVLHISAMRDETVCALSR